MKRESVLVMQEKKLKVLNLMTGGQVGGIETLCYNWGKYAPFQNGFAFLTERGAVYEKMLEANFDIYDLTQEGSKISLSKIRKLIMIAKDYDIVMVHHGDPILRLYYIILSYHTKCKMVSYVHSCYGDNSQLSYGCMKNKMYEIIFQKAFDVSDAVIAVSKAGEKSYEQVYSVPQSKKYIVYNGIGSELINTGKQNVIDGCQPYKLLYIGRLNKIKGVDLLLRAVSTLKNDYELQLSIVGDGPERETLESLMGDLGLEHIVCFCGESMDIQKYLSNADIFIYPSTCQEVFGISLVEALSYGVPCVANCLGGIPEIIQDGYNGILTEETSSEGLTIAIKKLLDCCQNGTVKRYSENAKKTALKYTIDNNCNQVNNILEKI